jgi:hypothetical protein
LNTDKQIAYFEASGNTFDNTPIMSLDRVFRKTDLINHDQILSTIQPIIQPFVGSIEEANIISTTLQQNNDNPRLLVALQRNINNFSNKSSTTTIGTLYSNLVEAVVNIDSTLSSSEELEKRLVVNKKIKDYRQVFDFSLLDNIQITSTPNDEYLHLPFITRKIEVRTRPANAEEDFLVDNTSFLFFDYEKALNYKSEISNLPSVFISDGSTSINSTILPWSLIFTSNFLHASLIVPLYVFCVGPLTLRSIVRFAFRHSLRPSLNVYSLSSIGLPKNIKRTIAPSTTICFSFL